MSIVHISINIVLGGLNSCLILLPEWVRDSVYFYDWHSLILWNLHGICCKSWSVFFFFVTWIVHWDHQYMFYSIFSNESVTLIQISLVTVACSSFYNSFLPFSWYGRNFETAQWISDGRSSNKILPTSAIVSICPKNIMLSFWTFRILEKTLILQLQTLSMIILSLTQE